MPSPNWTVLNSLGLSEIEITSQSAALTTGPFICWKYSKPQPVTQVNTVLHPKSPSCRQTSERAKAKCSGGATREHLSSTLTSGSKPTSRADLHQILAPSASTPGRPGHTQHLNRARRSHLCSLNWLTRLDLRGVQLSHTAVLYIELCLTTTWVVWARAKLAVTAAGRKEPNALNLFRTYSSVHLKSQLCCFNRRRIQTLLRASALTLLHGLHQQVAREFPYWNLYTLKVPERYLWVMLINPCLIAVKGIWQISQRGGSLGIQPSQMYHVQ